MVKEVLLIIIGAIIGFVPSVCILIVERLFDFIGEIKIYYKFVSDKISQQSWGVQSRNSQMLVLVLPVFFEIQNTKNASIVIRDIDIEMYKGREFVGKMVQITNSEERDTSSNQTKVENFGAENNSYSIVLSPRSIQKIKCFFTYHISQSDTEIMDFDSLYLTYYDEKDKKVSYLLKDNLDGWNMGKTNPDRDWILLK